MPLKPRLRGFLLPNFDGSKRLSMRHSPVVCFVTITPYINARCSEALPLLLSLKCYP